MTAYRDRLIAGVHSATPAEEMSKTDLQDALRALEQPTSGSKAELAERLAEAQAAAGASADAGGES
jgi:hypothetical protein